MKFDDVGHLVTEGGPDDGAALATVKGTNRMAAVIVAARRMRMGSPFVQDASSVTA
jgi:hypothetical protein